VDDASDRLEQDGEDGVVAKHERWRVSQIGGPPDREPGAEGVNEPTSAQLSKVNPASACLF